MQIFSKMLIGIILLASLNIAYEAAESLIREDRNDYFFELLNWLENYMESCKDWLPNCY